MGEGSETKTFIRHCEEPKVMWQSRTNKKLLASKTIYE
jgi:hypothetical protein